MVSPQKSMRCFISSASSLGASLITSGNLVDCSSRQAVLQDATIVNMVMACERLNMSLIVEVKKR